MDAAQLAWIADVVDEWDNTPRGVPGPIKKQAFTPFIETQEINLSRLEPNTPDSWMQTCISHDKAVLLARSFMVRSPPTTRGDIPFFYKLVHNKSYFATLIWKSAFVYRVSAIGQPNEEVSVFVRLRDPQGSSGGKICFVDVVAVKESADGATTSMLAAYREFACLSRLLSEFCPQSVGRAQPLCPMCCGSDLFVRLGYVPPMKSYQIIISPFF